MRLLYFKLSLIFLFLMTLQLTAMENSTVSVMENFEAVDYLPPQKFSRKHFQEIQDGLAKKGEKIRLMSYNMLFDLYDHNMTEENRWPARLPRIVDLIYTVQPDIISTQELYPNQVADLTYRIGDEFAFYSGVIDEDGESYGIFYRKDRFTLISSGIYSPMAMIELQDVKTGKNVRVFNTHLAFKNIEKREAQVYTIAEIIKPFAETEAVIFTGDLNTFPQRLDRETFPFFDGDNVHRILRNKASLTNAADVSLLGHFGPISTFTNQDPDTHPFEGIGTPGVLLDHIYVSDHIRVLAHATESGTVDGHFPSDHMPVLIDFISI